MNEPKLILKRYGLLTPTEAHYGSKILVTNELNIDQTDCANFIPDGYLWGDKVRRGGCKISPFRTDKWGSNNKSKSACIAQSLQKIYSKGGAYDH